MTYTSKQLREHLEAAKAAAKPETNGHHPPGGAAVTGAPNQIAWAQAILEDETRTVAATFEGSRLRNKTLNDSALRCYRIHLAGLLGKNDITNALADAAHANHLPTSEIRTTLNSAWCGANKPDKGPADDVPEPLGEPIVIEVSAEEFDLVDDEEQQEKPPPPPLWARLDTRLLDYDALQNLPEPQPLIEDVLDQGTVALIYGKWGTCKTFIAIDWACSVATGRNWQGRATHRRKALYVAAEGAFGYRARMQAWTQAWNQPLGADILILPIPVNLTRLGDVRELCALIEHHGFGFIGLDTLARCMVGGDENSARDCGIVIDAMCLLREATPEGRGVICGVHHAGKDGKTFRGSSAFEGGADTVYFTDRDGQIVVLEREKRRDGPCLDHHELRLDQIEDTGSAIIIGGSANDMSVCPPSTDRSAKLMSIFVQHFAHTGATKAELREIAQMPHVTFYRAVNDLLQQGDLINMGTDQRPFYMTHPSKS